MAEHGVIVKGIAGFYYVDTGERVYQCKARGIFRKKDMTPFSYRLFYRLSFAFYRSFCLSPCNLS